ncbi:MULTISPECIES: LLM class flavin-dependent oxidoreductase [unclassified Parafrankia]|uniref:LLM class flavin-dependent oxidoreductase n=1 Tax=unclassified Parafrankia TaxID=2994368 RepID=UPI000DA49219|nr:MULTISPECIES: TIGR03619 family F420-dependent LLM class oxidoreductase [unclassified Parafrankia]TCJ35077.1 TIGR03619 family F420-dependent LLM class oxidoreductase [Parafrankia sp. BMG5.11]SQE00092.1 Luciferase family protein [Parafrankia sp. Ea1.12]
MAAQDGVISVGFVAGADLKRAAALEDLPIDSLWTGGHVASRNPSGEAMMSLARLSAVTERVRIGTAILLLPLYAPAIVAKQVADLDRATGGRLVLGVGIGGEYPQEFSACQVPVRERGRRTDEAIGLLRRLWTAQTISHDGPFYPMTDVRIHPAPAQPGGPPVIVAGRKEPAMRRAALLGDGWMPYLYSPRRYAASARTIRQAAADAGRDLSGFEWYAFVFVNVDPDGDRAREEAARTMGGTYNQDFKTMVDSVAAAGTAEEVTSKLRDFVDAGARHFIFMPAPGTGDPDRIVHRLLDEVIPPLRAHGNEQAAARAGDEAAR